MRVFLFLLLPEMGANFRARASHTHSFSHVRILSYAIFFRPAIIALSLSFPFLHKVVQFAPLPLLLHGNWEQHSVWIFLFLFAGEAIKRPMGKRHSGVDRERREMNVV